MVIIQYYFILLHKFPQYWSLEILSLSYVPSTKPTHFYCLVFLIFQHYNMLQVCLLFVFSAPILKPAISPRRTFYRKMALETKIWVLDMLIATKSLLLGPFKFTQQENDPVTLVLKIKTIHSLVQVGKKNTYIYRLFHIHLTL